MKKRGFTLVELMAVLSIFSIAMVLISGVLLQGYNSLNRTNNYSNIEDMFRTAILNIESKIEEYENKEVIIYSDKNRITIVDENYPEDKQQALMCIIPDKETIAKSVTEKVIYMQVENKAGDKQLIQVEFEDSDKDKFLEKENGIGPKVKITPKSTKVLISKLDESGEIIFEKSNEIINISVLGIASGKYISNKVYSNSISLKERSGITMEFNNTGTGNSGNQNNNSGNENNNPGVSEDNNINDFIKNMKHNVNVAGHLESHNSNDKHNTLIGSAGYITASGWKQTEVPGEKNESLKPITFSNINIGNLTISATNNSTIAKFIEMPEGQSPYYVYLVNGDVNLIAPHSISNIIIISSGTIKISGEGGNGNEVKEFEITDSILYSTNMDIEQKKGIKISGLPIGNILKKNAKSGKTVSEELKSLLINAKANIVN